VHENPTGPGKAEVGNTFRRSNDHGASTSSLEIGTPATTIVGL
jgi:hypothetical protein